MHIIPLQYISNNSIDFWGVNIFVKSHEGTPWPKELVALQQEVGLVTKFWETWHNHLFQMEHQIDTFRYLGGSVVTTPQLGSHFV